MANVAEPIHKRRTWVGNALIVTSVRKDSTQQERAPKIKWTL